MMMTALDEQPVVTERCDANGLFETTAVNQECGVVGTMIAAMVRFVGEIYASIQTSRWVDAWHLPRPSGA